MVSGMNVEKLYKILKSFKNKEKVYHQEIYRETRFSNSTVYYFLKILIKSKYIKRLKPKKSEQKLKKYFTLTKSGKKFLEYLERYTFALKDYLKEYYKKKEDKNNEKNKINGRFRLANKKE